MANANQKILSLGNALIHAGDELDQLADAPEPEAPIEGAGQKAELFCKAAGS